MFEQPGASFAYRATYALTRAALRPFVRLRVSGREHLEGPRHGPCLLAANHISHFDFLLVSFAARRQVDYLTSAEFFHPAPLGAWMRRGGAFPVNRAGSGAPAVRVARRRLRAGRWVGVFPEGGIRAEGSSILGGAPVRPSLRRLAVLLGVPVLPCVVLGADRLYDARRWRPGRGRVPVWIGFGPAIQPRDWPAPGASADLFAERLRAVGARLQGEFRLQPADLPTTPQRRMAHF